MVHSTEHWALGQWPSSSQQTYGSQITVCGFGGHVTLQYAIDATIDAYNKGLAYCYMCESEYQLLPSWLPQYADAIRAWQGAGPSPFTKSVSGFISPAYLSASLVADHIGKKYGWGWGGYDSVWLTGNLQSRHIGDGGKIYRILPADLEMSGALTGTPDTPPEASTCVCIAASGDDGHTGEYGHHTCPTWYEVGQVASGAWYESWFMFRNVVLPIGASMTKATLRTVHTQWDCNTQLKIRAVKLSNPANPVSMADYRSLARTTAAVDWNAGFDDSLWHDSPNIKSVIQELIDTYDFSSGRDILVMVDNDGCAAGISHIGVSYDNGPGCFSPQLHLEYSVSAPPVVEEKYLVGKLNHTFFPMGGIVIAKPLSPWAGSVAPSGGVATLVKAAVGGELTSAGIGVSETTGYKSLAGAISAIGHLDMISGVIEIKFTPADLDATLDEQNPDTEYGAETTLLINSKADELNRMILEFDLTVLPAGITIHQAHLGLYHHSTSGSDPAGETVRFLRCTRPGDAVEAEVNWNDYKAATAWTVAGGDMDAALYADVTVPASIGNWMSCDLKAITQDAIDNRSEILTLIGKYLTESESSDVTKIVAAGADDGFSDGTNFYATQTWIEIGCPGAGSHYDSFLRFLAITIPQGATITAACLKSVHNQWDANTHLRIFAEDAANPAAPTTAADHAGRTRTSNYKDWDSGYGDNGWHDSPDFKEVIQELIDSYDYSSGAALTILVDNDGSADAATHISSSYEGTEAYRPKLYIAWNTGGSGDKVAAFRSSEFATEAYRPKLDILYYTTLISHEGCSGVVTATGNLIAKFKAALSGALSSAGVPSFLIDVTMTGALTFTAAGVGDKITELIQPIDGSVELTGTLAKKLARILTGSITPIGSPFPVNQVLLSGVFDLSGTVSSATAVELKNLAGTLESTGAAIGRSKRTITGNVYLHSRKQNTYIRSL